MIVVDTSAVLSALVSEPKDPALIERIKGDPDLHAPHIIDVEVIHALRRLVYMKGLTEDRAMEVRSDFDDLVIVRYPHRPLSDRMWDLRHNLTAYDAAFVALSEELAVPLVTCDSRMARAKGHQAHIELYRAGP